MIWIILIYLISAIMFLNILIKECKENDIVEIDTFNELKQIDKTYDV